MTEKDRKGGKWRGKKLELPKANNEKLYSPIRCEAFPQALRPLESNFLFHANHFSIHFTHVSRFVLEN